MIRDLNGVLEREKAEMGFFITLNEPTRPMIIETLNSGLYRSPDGSEYPKIQILTIEQLLNGIQPKKPRDLFSGAANFKKSKPKGVKKLTKALLF
jgi:hypothetical protein